MTFLLGVLIFVAALLISVMVHEAGHFATAKAFRMKVTQYFVGFGPTLWSWRRGETEYGVKAIWLGGFVKIIGMTAMEEIDPSDEARSFRRKPGWQRAIVLVAGSFMHFVLAFVLLLIVAAGIGMADGNTTTVSVLSCVPASATGSCTSADPRSPASQAGLKDGDKIIAVAGTRVRTWTDLGKLIRAQPAGQPVSFEIQRGTATFTTKVTLATPSWHKGAFLGVSPTEVFRPAGPVAAIRYTGNQIGTFITDSVRGIGDIPRAIPYLFAKNRASTPGGQIASVVGVAEGSGQVVSARGVTAQEKAWLLLRLIADLNVFFALLNLLPLLPFDGGHLAVVAYERARALLARLRHRPDPGLVDMQKLLPISMGVFALLIGLSVVLIAADLVNPINLSG